jgi:hypothetical protein
VLKNLVVTRILLYYYNKSLILKTESSEKSKNKGESPPYAYPPLTPPSVSPLPREPYLFGSYGALCSVYEIFLEIWMFSIDPFPKNFSRKFWRFL